MRYDQVVDEFVALNSYSALQRMNTEYPQETKLLIEDVLAIGRVDDPRIEQALRDFYLDSTVQVLIEDVHLRFRNLDTVALKLEIVFSVIKEIDPHFKKPRVYTQISALNQSIVIGDSILGISLDKYLGEDYPLYKNYYYAYQRRSMKPEYIVPDALSFYLLSEYPLPGNSAHTLLERMLHTGKIHWIISHVLKENSQKRLFYFDKKRLDWCKANENKIWHWLKCRKLLHTTDPMKIQMLLRARENTPCFGSDSPDRLGVWMGMRIVDSYMKNNPGTTIADLLKMNNYQKMLANSGYSPK